MHLDDLDRPGRQPFRFNKQRRIVQGVFHPYGPGGPRLMRRLASFAELEIAPDGALPADARRRQAALDRLTARYM